jgi:hypothetical protein
VPSDDPILNLRLEAVKDAQQKARVAFYVSTLVTAVILAGLWNEYLSWDRTFSLQKVEPADWAQKQLLTETIKAWLDNQMVGVAILGIRFSVSDVAVLGSAALLFLSAYLCICMRRVNQETGSLLWANSNADATTKWLVYYGVRSFSVFAAPDAESAFIFNDLKSVLAAAPRSIRILDKLFSALLFLPVFAIAAAVASDIYFGTIFTSPFRENAGPAWDTLDRTFRIQLVAMDTFGGLVGTAVFVYCRNSALFHRATGEILRKFKLTLLTKAAQALSDDDNMLAARGRSAATP